MRANVCMVCSCRPHLCSRLGGPPARPPARAAFVTHCNCVSHSCTPPPPPPSHLPACSNLNEGITICDPSLKDCPVVYCNDAFLRCLMCPMQASGSRVRQHSPTCRVFCWPAARTAVHACPACITALNPQPADTSPRNACCAQWLTCVPSALCLPCALQDHGLQPQGSDRQELPLPARAQDRRRHGAPPGHRPPRGKPAQPHGCSLSAPCPTASSFPAMLHGFHG